MSQMNDPFEQQSETSQFASDGNAFTFLEACMGTVFVFKGSSSLPSTALRHHLGRAADMLHEADRTFSLYKPESHLSQLANGKTNLQSCPPVVAEVWKTCDFWEEQTDGWFSAFTAQNTFDPAGLVKTWAAKAAFGYLLEQGISNLTMNAGGDILISDETSDRQNWRVAIHKPVSIASADSGLLAVVDLYETKYRAIATSGSAERGSHIWNPKAPGKTAASNLLQVTVLASDLVTADVWATAIFAAGNLGIGLLEKHNSRHPEDPIAALTVDTLGALNATDGFAELFAKTS